MKFNSQTTLIIYLAALAAVASLFLDATKEKLLSYAPS